MIKIARTSLVTVGFGKYINAAIPKPIKSGEATI
jgi:hypothetical protein